MSNTNTLGNSPRTTPNLPSPSDTNAVSPSNMLSSTDFFGEDDPNGLEKFVTVAVRAIYEQKLQGELNDKSMECARLKAENASLKAQVAELKVSLDENIDDRERVLAFKTEQLEELQTKLKSLDETHRFSLDNKESETVLQNLFFSTTVLDKSKLNGGPTANFEHGLKKNSEAYNINNDSNNTIPSEDKPSMGIVNSNGIDFKRLYQTTMIELNNLKGLYTQHEVSREQLLTSKQEIDELKQLLTTADAGFQLVLSKKEEKIQFLEKRLVFEQERSSVNTEKAISECRQNLEREMEEKLDMTTRKAIAENFNLQKELQFQSNQVHRLLKRLDVVAERKRKWKEEYTLAKEMNDSLSHKLRFYNRLFSKIFLQNKKFESLLNNNEPTNIPSVPPESTLESSITSTSLAIQVPVTRPNQDLAQEHQNLEELCLNIELTNAEETELKALTTGGEILSEASKALEIHLKQRDITNQQVQSAIKYRNQLAAMQNPRQSQSSGDEDLSNAQKNPGKPLSLTSNVNEVLQSVDTNENIESSPHRTPFRRKFHSTCNKSYSGFVLKKVNSNIKKNTCDSSHHPLILPILKTSRLHKPHESASISEWNASGSIDNMWKADKVLQTSRF